MKQPYIVLTINFFFLTLSATLPESTHPTSTASSMQGIPIFKAQIHGGKVILSPEQMELFIASITQQQDSDDDSDEK